MKRVYLFLLFALVLLAAGCGQEEPTPEPTPLPATTAASPSPEPEATDVPPTETPEPTATSLPTETPEPSPTPLSAAALVEIGDTQLLLSDWRGAEDAYRQAVESEPENALAHARLSYLLHFHPQTEDEAVEVAREAAELAPNDLNVVPFLILALNRVGQYEEALSHAEQIRPLAFNDAFALSVILELAFSTGDYEEADNLINIVISLSGLATGVESVEVDRILTVYSFLNGSRSLANINSIRLLESVPQFAPAYLVRAEVLASSGLRGVTPRGLVTEGLILDSDYVPLMVQLARIDAQAGNFELALDSCEDLIRLFPGLPDGLLCQGDVLLQQEMYEQARETFEQVIRQHTADYRGYIGRGQANLGMEACETAVNNFLAALEYQPYAFQAYAALGQTYQCQGNTAEAETVFQKALALRPSDVTVNFALGSLYMSQNRVDEAGDAFLRAVYFAPAGSVPPVYFSELGRTFQVEGRCNFPASSLEITYYLCAGGFLVEVEEYLKAGEAFSLALDLDENSASALGGLVVAYSNQRLCDVALSYLTQLSENNEPSSEVLAIYDSNCTAAGPPQAAVPEGDLVSEDEAIRIIETAVAQVEGAGDIFVFFDTYVFENEIVGEQRILIVQLLTNYDRGSAELNRQLSEFVFAAAEGFALAESEPYLMFIQARTSLTDTASGFIVARLPTILWYNGDISTAQYRQTWIDVADIQESIEEGGQNAYHCCALPQERYFYSFREKAVTMPRAMYTVPAK